jgi:hypothetical protein
LGVALVLAGDEKSLLENLLGIAGMHTFAPDFKGIPLRKGARVVEEARLESV